MAEREPGPARAHPELTIGALFLAQADRTPGSVAVTCAGRSLTYARLRSEANRLARHLRGLGVGPEVPVGVCLDRGVELVVAILGTVLAGGAYVPIDPDSHEDVAARVADDARLPVVICASELADRFDRGPRSIVDLNRDRKLLDAEADDDLTVAVGQDNLLAVTYTSGSTGRPKGVLTCHAQVVGYVTWCLANLPLGEAEAVPLTSSVAFAGANLAFFGSLLSGKRLIVPDPDDPFSWCAAPESYSFVKLSPSALRYVHRRFGQCWDRWGCVILAHEPVRPADWQLVGSDGRVPVVVDYGTTETSGSTAWWPAEGDGPSRGLPIGRPLPTVRVLILDRWGDPVPPGVPGEIFVGGPAIARGYLGQSELTDERFVADPAGPPESRLFRTGDRARWEPDGGISFLGRVDRQAKIRGYRVELDEVERELQGLAGVRDAVVVAAEEDDGGLAVAAYVAARPGDGVSADGLRAALERRLPPYAIPTRFAMLAALPRTAGGKVDYSALAAIPSVDEPRSRPPRTETERAVAAIWRDVLRLDDVNRDDNFFTVGGHSLRAMEVILLIAEQFDVELSIQTIFEAPTVAALAEQIDGAEAT